MATWSDKLVGEVVRLLLEAFYDPQFPDSSHGFRKSRGCHTALREIGNTWTGTTWFIEGDISDCFGSLDHETCPFTGCRELVSADGWDWRLPRLFRRCPAATSAP